nr:MAG TPA: protein of unknown function (DUF5506) [Caudoviricetes sp.]
MSIGKMLETLYRWEIQYIFWFELYQNKWCSLVH